jgi:hypothetical protein
VRGAGASMPAHAPEPIHTRIVGKAMRAGACHASNAMSA